MTPIATHLDTRHPIWVATLFKTLFYCAVSAPVLFAERAWHFYRETGVLGEGIVIVRPDARILWANETFEKWCGGPVHGRTIFEALDATVQGPDLDPLASALQGTCMQARLQRHDQFLELNPKENITQTAGELFLGSRPLPPLPQKMTPAQAARMAELLEFLHRHLSAADRREVVHRGGHVRVVHADHYNVVCVMRVGRREGGIFRRELCLPVRPL